jgi:hypothetical protein
MMRLVSTLAVLAIGSLRVSPIVSARLVILVSISILVILVWGVAIIRALILVALLVWPVFSLVSVASLSMVYMFQRLDMVATP